MKKNSEVFARYFHKNINFCIENSIFLFDLKVVDVSPVSKRNPRLQKITTDPLAFYLIYLKDMKDVFTTKCRITLIISYLNITGINTILCNLLYFLEGVTVASYADDTTAYTANKTNDLVIKEIEHFSEVLFKWFDSTTGK